MTQGARVYAVGDIHGRLDLLDALQRKIATDWAAAPVANGSIVYLGDYVDRGSDSAGVVELLLSPAPENLPSVYLLGNHEKMLLNFHRGAGPRGWLSNGGDATLISYGLSEAEIANLDDAHLREEFHHCLPRRHLSFFESLTLVHCAGDYCFVHAGLRPGVPLDRQDRDDMIWIRDRFLDSDADFGKIVIHGHTIAAKIDWRANRIGIDTGAYYSGRLTCLVLEGTERRILQT